MMFLLRCMLCLSIVYAAILGFTAPRAPRRAGVGPATASRGGIGDSVAKGVPTLCRQHPADCLAALAALSQTGLEHGPGAETHADPVRTQAATAETVALSQPRHQQPAFRLTKTP